MVAGPPQVRDEYLPLRPGPDGLEQLPGAVAGRGHDYVLELAQLGDDAVGKHREVELYCSAIAPAALSSTNSEHLPLCRLRYGGSAHSFGFAIYSTAKNRYEDSILLTGHTSGSPQDALDTACTIHLTGLNPNPTHPVGPPTTLRSYPLSDWTGSFLEVCYAAFDWLVGSWVAASGSGPGQSPRRTSGPTHLGCRYP